MSGTTSPSWRTSIYGWPFSERPWLLLKGDTWAVAGRRRGGFMRGRCGENLVKRNSLKFNSEFPIENIPRKFNSSTLENGGWKTIFPLGFGNFSGRTVKLRGGRLSKNERIVFQSFNHPFLSRDSASFQVVCAWNLKMDIMVMLETFLIKT